MDDWLVDRVAPTPSRASWTTCSATTKPGFAGGWKSRDIGWQSIRLLRPKSCVGIGPDLRLAFAYGRSFSRGNNTCVSEVKWSSVRGVSRRQVLARGALGALAGLTGLPTAARAQTPEHQQVEIWAVRDPQEAAAIAIAKELNFYK